ncbi:SPARC-related modular calcium-binding protein 1 isoform X2 [Bombyx mandarina]|uniref:SPARC-related modular calcium-binding protein 1 n=2 Tax=Bombyx TaxID=7090 RepID=A0A8R2ASU4_BOMMO|nr:SPARC-related modular calcium-binding protein 1 isoform X2 [Bombyx mori]XP_028035423.1 SPARC-related modular calcium-binding protein 1 isoform X2 [Bombyx mandarina]
MNIFDSVFHLLFLHIVNLICGAAPDVQTSEIWNELCKTRAASCETNASSVRRPVCGTNGRTYASRCLLMKAQCNGELVAIARKGPCLDGQSSCLIAHRYALNAQAQQRAPRPAYIPRCRADGTYAAVQCGASGTTAAGCWCVTPDGKPLPDTAVRNGRPDCTRTGKSHARRRSSIRGQRNKKSCTRTDRALFNGNLIKIFNGEYERMRSEASGLATESKIVAEWKFRELDRDKSDSLQKSEYRGLRKLIKKVVKPKRCARAWARGCDGNGDGEIARAEWTACLLANPEPPTPDYEDSGPEVEPDYEEEPPPDPSSVLPGMRNSFAPDGSDSDSRREDEANDCSTDRQAVLDEQKAGGAALYVPECTGDGRYARAQCYRSTGYCWCVHQDTGKPIPGSSVKDRRPDCDAAPQHASPMRGCPEPTKAAFLKELRSFFASRMTASGNGTAPGDMVKWGASREEQAATWTYVMLDKDKDKALERREWKAFHQLINSVDSLRKCGRKLPRYCDVNHDSKISITEWMACLEVTQVSQGQTTEVTKLPPNPRRKGPNPLESILKADD